MPLIVDDTAPVAWATREQARMPGLWADAPTSDAVLDVLLRVATVQCRAYVQQDPVEIPENYMLATIYQARENYAAAQREGDVIGIGDYAIRSRPLTGAVKQLLRPKSVTFTVG